MRRCDRYAPAQTDPYSEFSFEKSLRKYEISPHKKIKMRSFVNSQEHATPLQETKKNQQSHLFELSEFKLKDSKQEEAEGIMKEPSLNERMEASQEELRPPSCYCQEVEPEKEQEGDSRQEGLNLDDC
jgi:hypothetical protein